MSFIRMLPLALLVLSTPALADPARECRRAITAAERAHGMPPGLLLAVATVESGWARQPGAERQPWPWVLRAEGRGQHFLTREAAEEHLNGLLARGVRMVDAGCLQVNLHHHPDAFPSPEMALNPEANVRYAAGFLARLRDELGDWLLAAGAYHSRTPARAEAYRGRVLAAWPAGRETLARATEETARREALIAAWAATRREPPLQLELAESWPR